MRVKDLGVQDGEITHRDPRLDSYVSMLQAFEYKCFHAYRCGVSRKASDIESSVIGHPQAPVMGSNISIAR